MANSLKEKLIIGVIVFGAGYVCFSPFIQLLLPTPQPPSNSHSGENNIGPGANLAAKSELTASASDSVTPAVNGGVSTDIAAAMLEMASNKPAPAALRQKFLQQTGLDRNVSESTRASAEQKLKELALAVTSGKNADALKLADAYIAFLNDYPGLDRRYLILAHTLAMQSSFKEGLTDKAIAYGDSAVALSRKNDDYMMNAIEPDYLQAKGFKANFAQLQTEFAQFDSQARSLDDQGMTATARRLHTLVENLPEDSFARLRADMYLAFVSGAGGKGRQAASELNAVAKRADSAGDTYLAAQCRTMAEASGDDAASADK